MVTDKTKGLHLVVDRALILQLILRFYFRANLLCPTIWKNSLCIYFLLHQNSPLFASGYFSGTSQTVKQTDTEHSHSLYFGTEWEGPMLILPALVLKCSPSHGGGQSQTIPPQQSLLEVVQCFPSPSVAQDRSTLSQTAHTRNPHPPLYVCDPRSTGTLSVLKCDNQNQALCTGVHPIAMRPTRRLKNLIPSSVGAEVWLAQDL